MNHDKINICSGHQSILRGFDKVKHTIFQGIFIWERFE